MFAALRLVSLIILLSGVTAHAESLTISVVALFNQQAVLMINQQQQRLKVGETSPEGVKLLAANSQRAIVEVNGKQHRYELATQIGGDFSRSESLPSLSLWPQQGLYFAPGYINDMAVEFLVDTGSSAVAINQQTADSLGVDYRESGIPVQVTTASGKSSGYQIQLDQVQLGEIKLYNVTAIVVEGAEPKRALLGMSFLGQLDLSYDGQRLDMKAKY